MSDARLVETRNQLTKCEKQLTSEQTKNKKLAGRVQELVTMTESSDANVKSKDEQVEILHVSYFILFLFFNLFFYLNPVLYFYFYFNPIHALRKAKII